MQDASSHRPSHDALPDDSVALRALLLAHRQTLAEQDALLASQRSAIAALEQDRDRWRRECEEFRA